MTTRQREKLQLIELPPGRVAVSAPPVLVASTHTVDYCCGSCEAVLMHAEAGQVHNLIIHCTQCGSYSASEQ